MRTTAWILTLLAWLGPPVWAYVESGRVAEAADEAGRYMCGLPMLAILVQACLASGVVALVATGLGTVAFFRAASPRSIGRKVELLIFATPMLLIGALLVLLLWPG